MHRKIIKDSNESIENEVTLFMLNPIETKVFP